MSHNDYCDEDSALTEKTHVSKDDAWRIIDRQRDIYLRIQSDLFRLVKFYITIAGIGVAILSIIIANYGLFQNIPILRAQWEVVEQQLHPYIYNLTFSGAYALGFSGFISFSMSICVFIFNIGATIQSLTRPNLMPEDSETLKNIQIRDAPHHQTLRHQLPTWIRENQETIDRQLHSLKESYQVLRFSVYLFFFGVIALISVIFAIEFLIWIVYQFISISMISIVIEGGRDPPTLNESEFIDKKTLLDFCINMVYPPEGALRRMSFILFTLILNLYSILLFIVAVILSLT